MNKVFLAGLFVASAMTAKAGEMVVVHADYALKKEIAERNAKLEEDFAKLEAAVLASHKQASNAATRVFMSTRRADQSVEAYKDAMTADYNRVSARLQTAKLDRFATRYYELMTNMLEAGVQSVVDDSLRQTEKDLFRAQSDRDRAIKQRDQALADTAAAKTQSHSDRGAANRARAHEQPQEEAETRQQTQSVTPNAYGLGVNSDEFGRPHSYRTRDGEKLSPIFQTGVKRDAYGLGVHADEFGRPVYDGKR